MEIQSIAVGEPPPSAQKIVGTGDGGSFTKTMAETREGQPDTVTTWIPTVYALAARFGSVFFVTLGGQLVAGGTGVIPAQTWQTAGLVSVSSAAVALILSLGTLFGNLEKKFPIVSQLT